MDPSVIPMQDGYPSCHYTFSEWGACQSNGVRTRTITSVAPPGCIGVPSLVSYCTYAAAPAMTCEARILYSSNDPTTPQIAPMGPWCDAAGVEIALAVMLAKLMTH